MIRPSEIIQWSNCQLRAYERFGVGRGTRTREIPHISGWVGSSVHASLSNSPGPEKREAYLYDSITPNMQTARSQTSRIVDMIVETMKERWWKPIKWEVEVGSILPYKGTIDVIIDARENEGGLIICDVKTGRVSTGVWLQLGAYMEALRHDNYARFESVAMIHAPRTALNNKQDCNIYLRDAEACRLQAISVADNALEILNLVKPALPSPGYHCSGCDVERCQVRAGEQFIK